MTIKTSVPRTTYTIAEVAILLGVAKNSAYQAVKRSGALGGVDVIRVGKRLVVPSGPLRAALGLPAESESLDDQTDRKSDVENPGVR